MYYLGTLQILRLFSLHIAVYFIMLSFLVHKIFTFYINDALKFKCSALQPVKRRVDFPLLKLRYLQELQSCEVVGIYRVQWLQWRSP
jgi:hypothetical protein